MNATLGMNLEMVVEYGLLESKQGDMFVVTSARKQYSIKNPNESLPVIYLSNYLLNGTYRSVSLFEYGDISLIWILR